MFTDVFQLTAFLVVSCRTNFCFPAIIGNDFHKSSLPIGNNLHCFDIKIISVWYSSRLNILDMGMKIVN